MTDDFDPSQFSDNTGSSEGLPTVELEFATLRRFREEMAPYLNYDGFFARSDRPLPRGTSVEFKFAMPEDFTLAEGTAVVAWTIQPEGNPDLVPGMALQFVEMGKQSRAVIDELVDFHIATGGDPFDLGQDVSRPGEIPTDSLSSGPGEVSNLFDSGPSVSETPSTPTPPPVEAPSTPAVSDFEEPATPSFMDEPLPDVLPEPETSELPGSDFQFKPADSSAPSSPEPSLGGGLGGGDDGFDVDIFGDESASDSTPLMRGTTPVDDLSIKTSSAHKPPRDIRLGVLVALGIILVAVVVMAFTFFFGRDEPEEAELQPMVQQPVEEAAASEADSSEAGSGVALVDGEPDRTAEGESSETAAEMAARLAAETAARLTAETGEEPPPEEDIETASGVAAEQPQDAAPDPGVRIEESAPPEPVEVPADPAPRAVVAADTVVDITADPRGGITTVSIRGNGRFDQSSFRSLRLEDPDRLWVKVSGIEADYRPLEIQVGSSEVDKVRIGHHPEESPPALYVVLDLVDRGVVLLDQTAQGDTIRISVGRN